MGKNADRLRRKAMRISWGIKAEAMTDNELADAMRVSLDPFTHTQAWRELRKLAAERYGMVCCKCGKDGTRRSPINFDHIKPRKYFPDLALDINNLQPLCGPCNKAKGNKHCTDYRS